LNGIDRYGTNSYLIAVRSGVANESAIFKIPIVEPSQFTKVTIKDGLFVSGADGCRFRQSNGDLYIVGNAPANVLYHVTSDDDWETATINNAYPTGPAPTSLVVLEEEDEFGVYVLISNNFSPTGPYYIEKYAGSDIPSSSSTGSGTGTGTGSGTGSGTGTGTGTGSGTGTLNGSDDGSDDGSNDGDSSSSLQSLFFDLF